MTIGSRNAKTVELEGAAGRTPAAAHDRQAPIWALGLVVLGVAGVSTTWVDLGEFWSSYVLDMCGPAWNYILFRGRFTSWADNRWTRFFTPARTLVLFLLVCIGIEGAQFFELYDSTYDPWDFVAYISLLVPLFIVDVAASNGARRSTERVSV